MTASKLSWCDLSGAQAGDWGLGREGHANLRKLLTLGAEPVLVDDRPPGPVDGRPVLATGDGGLAALERCDVVVKTPGLSRYRPEVAQLSGRGIPVVGGLGLWLAEADLRRVLCVTGTKGKSTTSSLTGHLLTGLGYRCLVGGNIGAVPYDPDNAGEFDYWVIEVSSYQATDLPVSPPCGRGHLAAPRPSRLARGSRAVLPGQAVRVLSARRRAHRGQRRQRPAQGARRAARPAGRVGQRARRPRRQPGWSRSACPAATTAATRSSPVAAWSLSACRAPPMPPRCARRRPGDRPLPSRRTPVGTVGGVTFVDDSLSTNVLPTLAALDAFPGRRVALIAGGHDRGIDYAPLAAWWWPATRPPRAHPPRQRPPHPHPDRSRHPRRPPRARPPRTTAFAGVTDCPDLAAAVAARVPLGSAGRPRAAVPGRAELRGVQGLPRPRRGLRPRRARPPLTVRKGLRVKIPRIGVRCHSIIAAAPVTERRPAGSSASPNDVPTEARTPCPASSAGIRDVSTSTFSWCSPPRRQAPAPSGTNVVASRTKRSGAGVENR